MEEAATTKPNPLYQVDVLLLIFSYFEAAKELGRIAQVCKVWSEVVLHDSLWKLHCERDWLSTEKRVFVGSDPCDGDSDRRTLYHEMDEKESYYNVYREWYREYGCYGLYFKRAKRAWDIIEKHLHSWGVHAALLPGVSRCYVEEFSSRLSLPLSLQVIYRIHNGQSTASRGIFGGYEFYDYRVEMYFLPLRSDFFSRGVLSVASSTTGRNLEYNCSDGTLNICKIRCTPESSTICGDSFLEWLEAYAVSLDCGNFVFESLSPGSTIISLFNHNYPPASRAVTRGLEIVACPVYVPESCRRGQEAFSYSIRMRLLPDSEIKECQLASRHWVITDGNNRIEEVSGHAVVGHFPKLKAGGKPFIYQSCTSFQKLPGKMHGSFAFVPGTLQNPTGESFDAIVAPFILDVPEFIF